MLRGYALSEHLVYLSLLGTLPNLGAAWLATMFGKWAVLFGCRRKINIGIHAGICAGVCVLALASEIVHDLFLNSSFDPWDMLTTVIAQLIVFALPLLGRDRYFCDYD